MKNEFTAIVEWDAEGGWFVAFSPEIPGGNGQGRTQAEAIANLGECIELLFEDLRDDAIAAMPQDAIRDVVTIG